MLLLEHDPLVRGLEIGTRDPGLSQPPSQMRRLTLGLWVVVVALAHFDRGATTVAAMDIVGAWGDTEAEGDIARLSFGYAVALLAWHSIGLALGSILAGAAFQQASAKLILIVALLGNATVLCILSFCWRANLFIVCALRAASGVAASFPLVYLPLWVDEFSPSEGHGQWMAVVQTGAPLGHFLGVVVAGVARAVTSGAAGGSVASGSEWASALLFQAIALLLVTGRVCLLPPQQVMVANVSSLRARLDSLTLYPAEGSQLGHLQLLAREMREMMQGVSRNPLTVSMSCALCLLHSTGAGLALWTAPYLALSEGAPSATVSLFIAALTLVSAPALGTYLGAVLCDRLDGFKSGHHAAALRVACGFVAFAALAGPVSSGASSFTVRLAVVTVWLIGAGGFLPICMGVLMTAMPSYLRSFSSTSSLLLFHLVGFALAPGAVAVLMGLFSRSEDGLDFGVGFALWATAPAAALLGLAYMREPRSVVSGGLAGVDDLTFSDISYELSRRRMSTAPL